jgi:hypothetical protein
MRIAPTRGNLRKGGAATWDALSAPDRLRALYTELLAGGNTALGRSFLQIWGTWLERWRRELLAHWEAQQARRAENELRAAAAAGDAQAASSDPHESEEEEEEDAPVGAGEAHAAFEGPRNLDAVIQCGVSEGRVGPEHLRHLRQRLAGDLRGEVRHFPSPPTTEYRRRVDPLPTGRERMGSSTLQTLQDPMLQLPWGLLFEVAAFQTMPRTTTKSVSPTTRRPLTTAGVRVL